MTDLAAAVRGATARLAAAGVGSPDADAVALAAHLLGVGPGEVRARMVLGHESPGGYDDLVGQRCDRVPLQHLTGRTWFRGVELEVGPGVFLPRPETEVVAGLAIELARAVRRPDRRPPVVVDLCTGSGAIALSVKDEVPAAEVHAIELSPLAHGWAARNVEVTALEVDLVLGDAMTAFPDLEGEVDVVVANPPYIPAGLEPLEAEVRDHDPGEALYGGSADGLAIPRLVAARACDLLRPGGALVLEHADTQGESLPAALAQTGEWDRVEDHPDLAGRPRATTARRRRPPTRGSGAPRRP